MGILNAVVTRKLELDLALEYLNNASIPGVSPDVVQKLHGALIDRSEGERQMFDKLVDFIKSIKDATGVPEKTVWGAFKEAYFSSGEKYMDKFANDMKKLTGFNVIDNDFKGGDFLGRVLG